MWISSDRYKQFLDAENFKENFEREKCEKCDFKNGNQKLYAKSFVIVDKTYMPIYSSGNNGFYMKYDHIEHIICDYDNQKEQIENLDKQLKELEEKYLNEKQARLQLLSMMPDAEKVMIDE